MFGKVLVTSEAEGSRPRHALEGDRLVTPGPAAGYVRLLRWVGADRCHLVAGGTIADRRVVVFMTTLAVQIGDRLQLEALRVTGRAIEVDVARVREDEGPAGLVDPNVQVDLLSPTVGGQRCIGCLMTASTVSRNGVPCGDTIGSPPRR